MIPIPRETPLHPGLHLERRMDECRITPATMAFYLDVPINRITSIIAGERAISIDTAFRLATFWGDRPEEWVWKQVEYDMALERKNQEARRNVVRRASLTQESRNAARTEKRIESEPPGGGVRQPGAEPVDRINKPADGAEAHHPQHPERRPARRTKK
jgi:addiction module HigA family antidote